MNRSLFDVEFERAIVSVRRCGSRIQNQGLCLTMTGESDAVFLGACDGRNEQLWDDYF